MNRIPFLILSLFSFMSFASDFSERLVEAAEERTEFQVRYDGSYHKLSYPNGDVPSGIGVCTDVIIRSYRKLGVDLQVLVHEDMRDNFSHYPSKKIWGLSRTDRNIDHRRVPNLQAFFERNAISLPVSQRGEDYRAGDIVTWMLPGNLPHIGILVNKKSVFGSHPYVVHNIGSGPEIEDILFDYKITGHYRFEPKI
ncbi:DUF1287 domain-containing protein [Psychromonas aquimarina]|uniref:DUF1287 domain-containing protein n=1 Tax=Psychromonas aquimarina TaxID=444919 RepID=UPI00041E9C0C|nr:DUF1287 domain-containing protein [Psychromonas aquimarina]